MSFPHKDFDVVAKDGLKLKARTYLLPEGVTEKAKILYVHGFSEHTGEYEHWFPKVAKAGYTVTYFDQRGFGLTARSPKDYGVTNDELAFSDLDTVYKTVFGNYNGPLLLWGHSMGGGITLTYMIRGTYRERFNGYIANSPFIKGHPDSSDWKAVFVPFLNRWFPSYRAKLDIDPAFCTDNYEYLEIYRNDSLRHNIASAPLAYAMINRGNKLQDPEFVKKIVDRPLLISHGTNDHLCVYDASKEFLNIAPLSDKTLNTYPDALHELMHSKEEEQDKHLKDIVAWLDPRQKAFNTPPSVANHASTKL